jgi:hypothetical protein
MVDEARLSVLARVLPGGKPAGVSVALSLSTDGGSSWKELERYTPHREHELESMWFNRVIRNADLRGDACKVRVAISGGGLSKVIANSAVVAKPRSASAIRVTHRWKEGATPRMFTHTFTPDAIDWSYSIAAGASVVNEELQLDAIPADSRP